MVLPSGPRHPTALVVYNWMRRPLEYLDELGARYGDTFTVRVSGLPPLVIFSDPDAVRDVFSDDGESLHAGRFNRSLSALLGEHSVLMLDGPEHRRHRRLLLPPFHGERMQAYGAPMVDATHRAVESWPLGARFPIHASMQQITLEVVLRTVFGLVDGAALEQIRGVLTELMHVAAWPPLLIPAVQKDLGPRSPWGRFVRLVRQGDELLFAEIRRRREEGPRDRADVLTLLLQARDEEGRPMTDAELRDELVTLLVAGHETTATALAWAFRWILGTPGVERRLCAELDEATRSSGLAPEVVARLPYLDAVVRETLRLQPVIPLVGRLLERPMRIGGHDLPAGVAVLCSIYRAQRRPSAFPEPERFLPERFLGRRFGTNELFPFGGGVRRCIGMAFALYEMKMVLATTFARTSLHLAPEPVRVVRRSVTLSPSRGCRVVLTRRSPRAEPAATEPRRDLLETPAPV